MVHPRHSGLLREEPRDAEGGVALLPEAQGERLDAPVQQEAGVRIE